MRMRIQTCIQHLAAVALVAALMVAAVACTPRAREADTAEDPRVLLEFSEAGTGTIGGVLIGVSKGTSSNGDSRTYFEIRTRASAIDAREADAGFEYDSSTLVLIRHPDGSIEETHTDAIPVLQDSRSHTNVDYVSRGDEPPLATRVVVSAGQP